MRVSPSSLMLRLASVPESSSLKASGAAPRTRVNSVVLTEVSCLFIAHTIIVKKFFSTKSTAYLMVTFSPSMVMVTVCERLATIERWRKPRPYVCACDEFKFRKS